MPFVPSTLCVLLLLAAVSVYSAADSGFVYPHDNGEVLRIPQGTPLTVEWTSPYTNLNLRVFQANADGGFSYNTLLSDVSGETGRNSYAWTAATLAGTGVMHFEVTQSSNGQSLNPLNSGFFYVTNGTIVRTIDTVDQGSSTSNLPTPTVAGSQSTSETTMASSAKSASASSDKGNGHGSLGRSIGLGVGLGLGLSLLITAILLFICRKRKRNPRREPISTISYISKAEDHEKTYREPSLVQVHEADANDDLLGPHPGLFEAPNEPVRHEMSAR